jgi:hypothetical protein
MQYFYNEHHSKNTVSAAVKLLVWLRLIMLRVVAKSGVTQADGQTDGLTE